MDPQKTCYAQGKSPKRVRRLAGNTRSADHNARLRSLFPINDLRSDLERLGLDQWEAARKGGVGKEVVWRWLRGETVPWRPGVFVAFLNRLGLDRAPYEAFLAAVEPVRLVCPTCGGSRTVKRSHFHGRARGHEGRRGIPRRADGAFELVCRPCSARHHGHLSLKRLIGRRLRIHLGRANARALTERVEQGDEDAQKDLRAAIVKYHLGGEAHNAQVLAAARRAARNPRSEKFRQSVGLSHVVRQAVAGKLREFHLCPLCDLWIYEKQWHLPCYVAWVRYHSLKYGSPQGKPSRYPCERGGRNRRRTPRGTMVGSSHGAAHASWRPVASAEKGVVGQSASRKGTSRASACWSWMARG